MSYFQEPRTRKLISTKGSTEGLINNYSILNDGRYFGKNGSQNYLVF